MSRCFLGLWGIGKTTTTFRDQPTSNGFGISSDYGVPGQMRDYALDARDPCACSWIRHCCQVKRDLQTGRRSAGPVAVIASTLIPLVEEFCNTSLSFPKASMWPSADGAPKSRYTRTFALYRSPFLLLMTLHILL